MSESCDDRQLTLIFEQLYKGQSRRGWSYEDLSDVQVLMSATHVWARRINEHGAAGTWVLLPEAK